MRVFVLGGTGSVGWPIARALRENGYEVIGLARSEMAAERIRSIGAHPLMGDMGEPQEWVERIPQVQAVIHAAISFGENMHQVEERLLHALLPALSRMDNPRFVYTGGTWLYGDTGTGTASENWPLDRFSPFAWVAENIRHIQRSPGIRLTAIHPAMVYDDESGGVLGSLVSRSGPPRARIIGNGDILWSLVHAADLAALYLLVLKSGGAGAEYNGVSISGVSVRSLSESLAKGLEQDREKLDLISLQEFAATRGEWARGFGLSQKVSGERARRELGWSPTHPDPVSSAYRLARRLRIAPPIAT